MNDCKTLGVHNIVFIPDAYDKDTMTDLILYLVSWNSKTLTGTEIKCYGKNIKTSNIEGLCW